MRRKKKITSDDDHLQLHTDPTGSRSLTVAHSRNKSSRFLVVCDSLTTFENWAHCLSSVHLLLAFNSQIAKKKNVDLNLEYQNNQRGKNQFCTTMQVAKELKVSIQQKVEGQTTTRDFCAHLLRNVQWDRMVSSHETTSPKRIPFKKRKGLRCKIDNLDSLQRVCVE